MKIYKGVETVTEQKGPSKQKCEPCLDPDLKKSPKETSLRELT